MEQCKLQIGCFVIIFYIGFSYFRECKKNTGEYKLGIFAWVLLISVMEVILDGVTAYTVNHLDTVNATFNLLAHMCFLLMLDALVFTMFLYMLFITEGFPSEKKKRLLLYSPFILNVLMLIGNIHSLEYRRGSITNYSMGISVYTCYVMVAVYMLFTIFLFLWKWSYIERHKRATILLYLLLTVGVCLYQMLVPEALVTALVPTIFVLGVYMNQENPAIKELKSYHHEVVTGFATLVEKRDDNTGGHIRRTSLYVELLAKELRKRGYYKNVLTKDYIQNLLMAAPMHDIGKIAVPDAILQKPGRLTPEEFAIMKQHSADGGKIIKETFGKLGDEEYLDMAYLVARYHHEKWNGKGYPEGLSGKDIPLCARIMAIADVFDAVSEKRCYRDAMPIDKCFDIIREGSGTDFEPVLVEVFLDIRKKIEAVHDQVSQERMKKAC